jgi:hypothetical protein
MKSRTVPSRRRAPSSPSTKPKPFVFVLMPFDQNFNDTYKFGIKGAAEDAGAYAERVDEQIFVEGMLDRIFNQINKADVIVADMTGKNANVFYEVGYAHALNKVVLLITQSADDIPFDLKHRQHIVYAGKIDKLRSDLKKHISWATGEAERRLMGVNTERISASLGGVPLLLGLSAAKAPKIKALISTDVFQLTLHVRNVSEKGLLEISHVYLFAERDAEAVPVRRPIEKPSELEFFTADPMDALDNLPIQFRLPVKLEPMPPSAVDRAVLDFTLKATECNARYRLRLHTAVSYFDFSFWLEIQRAV